MTNDPFHPLEEAKKILGPEVPYFTAMGALIYLANCMCSDIAFLVNLLSDTVQRLANITRLE